MFVCHSTRFTLGPRSERCNAAVLSHLFTNTSLSGVTASTGNELLVQSLISRTEFPLRAHECRPQSLHERAIELLRGSAQVFLKSRKHLRGFHFKENEMKAVRFDLRCFLPLFAAPKGHLGKPS